MSISLAVVGLGGFGSGFVPLFKSHPLVNRLALCDREPDRIKPFLDNPFYADKLNEGDCYTSFEDLLESDIDAVAIITQPWLHAPQCIAAMEKGKHVYSAVPLISLPDMDETLDWCDRLIETCRRTGRNYMLGETTYYRPETMFCRRMRREDRFGDFVHSEGEYCHDVDQPGCSLRVVQKERLASTAGQEWLKIRESYTKRGILGSPMNYPTHSTCGPVAVMGAHAVRASAIGYANRTGDPFFSDSKFSNVVGFYKMSNGASCRIAELRESPGRIGDGEETFRICGTRGTYSNGFWFENERTAPGEPLRDRHLKLTREAMVDRLPKEVERAFGMAHDLTIHSLAKNQVPDFSTTGHGGSHPHLVHEFVTAVAENRIPAINAWEAARYMAMGIAAHRSALRDGEWIDVPDWGDAP